MKRQATKCSHSIGSPTHVHSHVFAYTTCGDLNMLGPGKGTIRRGSLVGVGVALLEEVSLRRLGFEMFLLTAGS